jgi:hypothetical protein
MPICTPNTHVALRGTMRMSGHPQASAITAKYYIGAGATVCGSKCSVLLRLLAGVHVPTSCR